MMLIIIPIFTKLLDSLYAPDSPWDYGVRSYYFYSSLLISLQA
jgi:hypothetical protein